MTTHRHVLELLVLSTAALLLDVGCGGATETKRPSTSAVYTPTEQGEDQIHFGAAAATPRGVQVAPHPEAPPPVAAAPTAAAATPAAPAAKAEAVVVAEAAEDGAAEEADEPAVKPAQAHKSRKQNKKSRHKSRHKKSRKKRHH